jgi:hypothetical protein
MSNGVLPEEEKEVVISPALQARSVQQGAVDVTGGMEELGALRTARQHEREGTVITDPKALEAYKGIREERRADEARFAKAGDYDRDGKKDPLWQRFKGWGSRAWNKGKDDPLTPEKEDETEEFSRFMGGMTRQEFSMFLMEWGSLMMQNSEKGLGGAFGTATQGAMQGHLGREDRALAREQSQQKSALEERRVSASERTASFAGQAQGFTDPEGFWVVPKYNSETKEVTWERATDKDGNLVKGDPDKSRDYQGEKVYLENFFREAGWSDQEIADYFGKAKGRKAREQDLTDALMRRIDGAGILDVDPITGKKLKEFKEEDIKLWVSRMLAIEFGKTSDKEAADYLNEAQE